MGKYSKIIIMLAAIATVLAATASPASNFIKVAGIVKGVSPQNPCTLLINECDVCERSARRVAQLDSAGCFAEEIPFYYGHTFTINFNRGLFINAYAEPGDSVFLSIDATENPVEFHLSGDHSVLNEEYSHAVYDLAPLYYNIKLPADTVGLGLYLSAFKSEVARTGEIVGKYIRENSLHSSAAELLMLDNIFIPANMAIGFRGKSVGEQIAFFTDSLFDIANVRNTRVMIFPYHLSALLRRSPDYAHKMPKSLIRDLMYATMEDASPKREDFANPEYYDRLFADNTVSPDISRISPGNIAVWANDSLYNIDSVNPIEWLKKQYPSCPAYVDVSATWCGPCRAALAGSEGLREHFLGSDIVFAIIWLKSDMDAWRELAPRFRNAVHIFIPEEEMSNRIIESLNLQGFPSYYFIDRNGEISSKEIPHFNDCRLIDFLKGNQ